MAGDSHKELNIFRSNKTIISGIRKLNQPIASVSWRIVYNDIIRQDQRLKCQFSSDGLYDDQIMKCKVEIMISLVKLRTLLNRRDKH